MPRELQTASDVIDSLGGTVATARFAGRNWGILAVDAVGGAAR